jgi:hypothetical protein
MSIDEWLYNLPISPIIINGKKEKMIDWPDTKW